MVCQAAFDQGLMTIMPHLPHLSQPQATVLAWGSFGMGLARSCALTAVSSFVAKGMQRKEQTVRQQLRAWECAPPRKRGPKRQALHVETCCPVLLAGGLRWWQGPNWRWPSMRRRWGPAMWCWPSGWSLAVVRSRWPGGSCRPTPPMPGAGKGCGYCAGCGPPSPAAGR